MPQIREKNSTIESEILTPLSLTIMAVKTIYGCNNYVT